MFNRALKQFLECQDLQSAKGVALTEKIRDSAKDSVDRLLQIIPETPAPHSEILRKICRDQVEGGSEDLFLGKLDHEATEIRSTAASILSETGQINPNKLFAKLHQPNVSQSEIIEILFFQRENLKPAQIIANALKLDKGHAEQLLKLLPDSQQPLDIAALQLEPVAIKSPSVKIELLRYFARVKQPAIAELIGKFLADDNHTVVIEALKSLRDLNLRFDASFLLRSVEKLSEVELQMASEILEKQADEKLAPKVARFVCGKSDELRQRLIRLFLAHVSPQALEEFLSLLEPQDWWGRDQALKCLQQLANDKVTASAKTLVDHGNEFIRDQAQQLAASSSDESDLRQLWKNAIHENWQVREGALQAIGRSRRREAIPLLKKVLETRPETASPVLKAVVQLGFTKGLEVAFSCLRMPEALVQREALETIGKLTNERHARLVRDKLMQKVPLLQATVRDTAGEVINRLTDDYKLPALEIDQETYFDTRLIKFEDTQAMEQYKATAEEPAINIEDLKKGDLWIDRYRIDREIGRGAMGRVMLATDEVVDETVILKFMHPELTADTDSLERFLREVKYSRKISHPNVIRVHDMLFRNNLSAISMEYFPSRGLDEFLREQKYFGVAEGLDILLQVANGMAAAHDQKVIHRDLKPSNILMDESGLVKIVDFGIASASSQSDGTLTKAGSIIGTPAYISPERARGKDSDHRSDIYALGIIAYGMFSGRLPYTGEPMSLLYQHIEGKAVPVHEIRKEVGPRVSLLVQKMMAVDINDRLPTMHEVADAIRGLQRKSA